MVVNTYLIMKLTQEQKWAALKLWLQMQAYDYKIGTMMTVAESVHGEMVLQKTLSKMEEIEKT